MASWSRHATSERCVTMLITPARETNDLRICPRLSLDKSQVPQKLPLQSQSSLASQIVCPISNQNGSKLSPLVPHIRKVSKKMWFRIWTKVMADQRINVPRLTWFIPFIGGQAALPAERCYFRIQYLVLFIRRRVFHCAIKNWTIVRNNNRYTIQQLNICWKTEQCFRPTESKIRKQLSKYSFVTYFDFF